MPHIQLNNDLPGIRGLMAFRPETASAMGELANALLRETEGLSPADRELIATYVSYMNDCFYCHHSHGEIATCYLGGNRHLVDQVR
ncbi:MAG TPA: carboxymuconolactone decarboxylase family protein, partial [Puia sp.]|nr:carboxymuconolactone decarboxylase family protein [Puia sp.]